MKVPLHLWFCMLLDLCEPYHDGAEEKKITFPREACVSGTNEVFGHHLSLLLLEMSNGVKTAACFPGTGAQVTTARRERHKYTKGTRTEERETAVRLTTYKLSRETTATDDRLNRGHFGWVDKSGGSCHEVKYLIL